MAHRRLGIPLIASVLFIGCIAAASDWPDRNGHMPEQILIDLIQLQQRMSHRICVGELAGECPQCELIKF